MTHELAQPRLLDLVYDELSPDEAREVERHAAECAPCTAELEGLLSTRRLAARLADEPVPARGRAELLALASRAVAPAPRRRRVRARAYAVVASAAVVVLVAGLTLRLGDQRSALKGRDLPDLHDLAPPEDVAPPALPGPAAKPPSPQPSPSKGEGAKRVAPSPRAAEGVERRPSASRSDAAAERKRAPPSPAAELPSQAAESPAPARAERPSAGASPQPLAAAPQRSAAPRAQDVERFAQPTQAPAAASAPQSQSIVEDIERRAADGQLGQERRRLSCDGASVERVALLDGARVVKLTVQDDDGTVHEGWYDEGGRLRAERRSTPGRPAELTLPEGGGAAEAAPAPSRALPARAPSPAALPRCGW